MRGEEEHVDVVRQGLRPAIDRVEGVRREGRRDLPPVVRLVAPEVEVSARPDRPCKRS